MGIFSGDESAIDWLRRLRAERPINIRKIRFADSGEWVFTDDMAGLRHRTGGYFSIEGLSVETNFGERPRFCQPVIHQPEIGILGVLVQKRQGEWRFLMQAKNEPGNPGGHQIAPTLQATESNRNRLHNGRPQPYLEYFTDPLPGSVLYSELQSEQGSRFYRKRNRNMTVLVPDTIDIVHDDSYRWLSYREIFSLMRMDNMVNTDARSVFTCMPELYLLSDNPDACSMENRFVQSLFAPEGECLNAQADLERWIREMREKYLNHTDFCSLRSIEGWEVTEDSIHPLDRGGFEVFQIAVDAVDREVPAWDQPIVRSLEPSVLCLFGKVFHGVLHFLVQGRVEPGVYNTLELTTTIQCTERELDGDETAGVIRSIYRNASDGGVVFNSIQSEEGGRFFHDLNRYLLIMLDPEDDTVFPDNYMWMTLGQMKRFLARANFLSNELRSLMAQLVPPLRIIPDTLC